MAVWKRLQREGLVYTRDFIMTICISDHRRTVASETVEGGGDASLVVSDPSDWATWKRQDDIDRSFFLGGQTQQARSWLNWWIRRGQLPYMSLSTNIITYHVTLWNWRLPNRTSNTVLEHAACSSQMIQLLTPLSPQPSFKGLPGRKNRRMILTLSPSSLF